jgi:hypothetical protein
MNNEEKECPFCSETIKFTAVKCKHCGSMLDDSSKIINTPQPGSTPPAILKSEPSFSGASYLILVLVAVALFLTNPTKQEFADYAWDKIINSQGDNELIKESGALGKGMIKAGINLFTTHNDYLIFSTFHVNTSAIDFITGDSTSVKIIGIAGNFIPYGSHGFGSSSTPVKKSSENIQVEKNEQSSLGTAKITDISCNKPDELIFACKTDRQIIGMFGHKDSCSGLGEFAYRSWNQPKTMQDKPDVDLINNDSIVLEGSGPCRHWVGNFETGNVKYYLSEIGCTGESEPPDGAIGEIVVEIDDQEKLRKWCFGL